MAIEGFYRFEKADSFTPENREQRVWVEEIDDGYRAIYLRCVGCFQIFRLGRGIGTRSDPITISEWGVIMPCVICPNMRCCAHMFSTLKDYDRGKAKDVFG